MTFSDSVKTCLTSKYACFSGRASRSEYWWFYLFTVLASFAVAIVTVFTLGAGAVKLANNVLGLLLLLPGLSVSVRRLHDTNHSGWWVLISFIPLIGWIWIFILMIKEGEKVPNKYGVPAL